MLASDVRRSRALLGPSSLRTTSSTTPEIPSGLEGLDTQLDVPSVPSTPRRSPEAPEKLHTISDIPEDDPLFSGPITGSPLMNITNDALPPATLYPRLHCKIVIDSTKESPIPLSLPSLPKPRPAFRAAMEARAAKELDAKLAADAQAVTATELAGTETVAATELASEITADTQAAAAADLAMKLAANAQAAAAELAAKTVEDTHSVPAAEPAAEIAAGLQAATEVNEQVAIGRNSEGGGTNRRRKMTEFGERNAKELAEKRAKAEGRKAAAEKRKADQQKGSVQKKKKVGK